jgi:Ion channel
MSPIATAAGLLTVLFVLWDAFETVVLPRRVSRRIRLTRFFYRLSWKPYRAAARLIPAGNSRENFLSVFGPLSLLLLLALWALSLVFGFALVELGLGSPVESPAGLSGFAADLYMSGTTFFTLGLGDVTPQTSAARVFTTMEAGTGFAFLALVISYLPILAQAFSRRESKITLLDARAGSPPTASELLRRHASADQASALQDLFGEWEVWAAELLESHVSFPVLAYYRSQHDNQSWVAAMTALLDASALVMTGVHGAAIRPARLTFAMARHALVDLSQVLGRRPRNDGPDRLPTEELDRLRQALASCGVPLPGDRASEDRLAHFRRQYEPYARALSEFLLMPLPRFVPAPDAHDNWQTTQ